MKRIFAVTAIASAAILGGGAATASAATPAPAAAASPASAADSGLWAWSGDNYTGSSFFYDYSNSQAAANGEFAPFDVNSVINKGGAGVCGYSGVPKNYSAPYYDFFNGGSWNTIGAPFSAGYPLTYFADLLPGTRCS